MFLWATVHRAALQCCRVLARMQDETLSRLEQFLDILVNGKGAGRRDLGYVALGVDFQRNVLSVDTAVVRAGAGDLEAVVGQELVTYR